MAMSFGYAEPISEKLLKQVEAIYKKKPACLFDPAL